MYKTITTEVEIDVDLEDFDTDDLVEELKLRGEFDDSKELIDSIWQKRRLGKDFKTELDELIYHTLGKIV